MKIYIDTNIFIDFYQASADPVGVVDTITEYADRLVVPEQTISEFHRNRISVLNQLSKNFSKSVDIKPWFSSLIEHLPEFEELTAAVDELKIKTRLVLKRLEDVRDPERDPVAKKTADLFARPGITRVPTTVDLIRKAQHRKLLGNPPTSPDKHTIGDEVIWESLLATVREDLIVVTRDRTYLDNRQLLQDEFRSTTGSELVLVTTKVSEALRKLGEAPPPSLIEEEDRISAEERCSVCGEEAEIFGFEGSDGDEAHWVECRACGHLEFL